MRKLCSLLACGAIVLACGQLLAQETETQPEPQTAGQTLEVMAVEVAGDQDGESVGGAFIIESSEDLGADGMKNMRVMAAPSSDMAFVGDTGMFWGGGDSFSMLSNPSVRKELELVDEQMDRIKEVNKEFGQRIRDSLGDLSKDGFDPGRASELKEVIGEIQRQKKDEINKLLLPHQQERLKQVALQMQMKSRGTANALSSDKIAEALGLTNDQIESLKSRSKELKKEIAAKTKQLQEDAKKELIGMLSSDQQRRLTEMMGDDFKSNVDDFRSDMRQRIRRNIDRRRSSDQD